MDYIETITNQKLEKEFFQKGNISLLEDIIVSWEAMFCGHKDKIEAVLRGAAIGNIGYGELPTLLEDVASRVNSFLGTIPLAPVVVVHSGPSLVNILNTIPLTALALLIAPFHPQGFRSGMKHIKTMLQRCESGKYLEGGIIYLPPLSGDIPDSTLLSTLIHEYTHHVQFTHLQFTSQDHFEIFREGHAKAVALRLMEQYAADNQNHALFLETFFEAYTMVSTAYRLLCDTLHERQRIEVMPYEFTPQFYPYIIGLGLCSAREIKGGIGIYKAMIDGTYDWSRS